MSASAGPPTASNAPAKSIVFFHPDLGIGGAERLVLDAALGLKSLDHKITIFTSHCDPSHCFDEARDGTLDVRVRGNSILPATIFGRFKILLTILRQYHLLLTIFLNGELSRLKPDAFFVDQLSAGIPILRWRSPETPILFYCHFPDLLLVRGRERWYKGIWRWPFDTLEGWGMRGADMVVANSGFTKSVVEGVWPWLRASEEGKGKRVGVGVVYPCVDTRGRAGDGAQEDRGLWEGKKVVLSINRFEQKKDVELAIRAFAGLKEEERQGVRLVIAGGYDSQVSENVSYHAHLVSLAESLSLRAATIKNLVTALNIPSDIVVLFLLSVPSQLKSMLLKAAKLLVYTPSNEHFGIVPLEAMLAGVPVLATNTGGPLETVMDGETGWLRPAKDVGQWTEVMRRVLRGMSEEDLRRMGEKGRRRVVEEFSERKMARKLDEEIEDMVSRPRQKVLEVQDALLVVGITGVVLIALLGIFERFYRQWLRS